MPATTTTTAKTWTPAQESKIESIATVNGTNIKGLIPNEDLAKLIETADFKGKTVNQLRAKIVNMGYYQKATPKTADKETGKVSRKLDYVKAIEIMTGCTDLSTLEKASKPQLEALSKALTSLSDTQEAEKPAAKK